IARRAKDGDSAAIDTVVSAIRGELVFAPQEIADRDEIDQTDAAMPKAEAGPQSIRITRDGEIIEGEDAASGSTLHEILAASQEPGSQAELAEDTPEEAPAKRRKRQPVEGPADFAATFQIDAMRACADTCDERVEEALLACATNGSDQTRQVAWSALSNWPQEYQHSDAGRALSLSAMKSRDPIIRSAAFSILAKGELPPEALRSAVECDDALLRAEAVAHLSPDLVETARLNMLTILDRGIDMMKPGAVQMPVILVGGGAVLVTGDLAAAKDVHRPEHAGVANAIGAAIAQVGGETEKIVSYQAQPRDEAIAELTRDAEARAIGAGASKESLRTVDIEETEVPYMGQETMRVRVKVIGDLTFNAAEASS
ncbi:MAG: hypothetical protein AAGE86_16115, partial [Pseudomonadota bacterium]